MNKFSAFIIFFTTVIVLSACAHISQNENLSDSRKDQQAAGSDNIGDASSPVPGQSDPAWEIMTLNNLAEACRVLGDYARAEPLYQHALGISKIAYGPEHVQTAVIMNNLALLYHSYENYTLAEPLYIQALAIKEKVCGPEHPSVAATLNHLAGLYDSLEMYAKVEPLYKRVLAIDEKIYGPDHPEIAIDLNNLALAYHSLGDYAKAEPLYQRALKIEERFYGPDHAFTGMTLNYLALVNHSLEKYAPAESFYKRALAIKEKTYGPYHPDLAADIGNLADLCRALGNEAQAEFFYRRALIIAEMNSLSQSIWRIRHGLSCVFAKLKYSDAAIFLGKHAVNALEYPGTDISAVKKTRRRFFLTDREDAYIHLADILADQERIPEALRVIAMLKKEEYADFSESALTDQDASSEISFFNTVEQRQAEDYAKLSDKLAAIGKELDEIRQKTETDLNEAEKARQMQLRGELWDAEKKFQQYLTAIILEN